MTTPELSTKRAMAGRKGAYVQHSRHDTRETTAAARRAFENSFLAKADPNNELAPAERQRRADAARAAHFADMQLRSAASRRKNRSSSARSTSSTVPQPVSQGVGRGAVEPTSPLPPESHPKEASSDDEQRSGRTVGAASAHHLSESDEPAGANRRAV